MDRLMTKHVNDLFKLGERIASALERLVDEPILTIEPTPPRCPWCGKVNPDIHVEQSGGSGNITEFVLEATCRHCGQPIFGLVNDWIIEKSKAKAYDHGKILAGRKNK